MTAIVEVTIPVGGQRYTKHIGMLTIHRLTPLLDKDDPDMEIHPYSATLHVGESRQVATLNHRYGDGIWTLISNALAALGWPENKEVR